MYIFRTSYSFDWPKNNKIKNKKQQEISIKCHEFENWKTKTKKILKLSLSLNKK